MSSKADTPVVYVGAYGICHDLSGRLLMVRMGSGLDEGRWTLPGGGVKWGENPDVAVIRELEEETGIVDIEAPIVGGVYSHTYTRSAGDPYPLLHHIGIIYNLAIGSFDLRCEPDGTTDCCEWFTEQQARSLPLTPIGEFAVGLVWPQS